MYVCIRKKPFHSPLLYRVTGSNSLELCQLLASTWPRGAATSPLLGSTLASSTSSTPAPAVLVLDDLHVAGGVVWVCGCVGVGGGVVETLKRYLPSTLHSGPAIIATCCPSTPLSTRLHPLWAALSPQQEPVRGLLGRVLRRRVAAAEAAANTRLPDAHHLAEWLARLWLHLNTLLAGHCGAAMATLGPGLLLDCPLGQEETQAWFLEVWNGRLAPHLWRPCVVLPPTPPAWPSPGRTPWTGCWPPTPGPPVWPPDQTTSQAKLTHSNINKNFDLFTESQSRTSGA
ncbi:Neuron navigator 3 [Chionoecetes opilio]|uniref:Neuron navigator 3 n=1 Tax=Chionoecetes opilio TaxID=41210 RepID=A0A8J5D357_CHIOP|nr:Neuron navigator 3 [Chionoecetes opilio]